MRKMIAQNIRIPRLLYLLMGRTFQGFWGAPMPDSCHRRAVTRILPHDQLPVLWWCCASVGGAHYALVIDAWSPYPGAMSNGRGSRSTGGLESVQGLGRAVL